MYGGGSKWEQSNALKEGCEILVATPVSDGGRREDVREGGREGRDGMMEGREGGRG